MDHFRLYPQHIFFNINELKFLTQKKSKQHIIEQAAHLIKMTIIFKRITHGVLYPYEGYIMNPSIIH